MIDCCFLLPIRLMESRRLERMLLIMGDLHQHFTWVISFNRLCVNINTFNWLDLAGIHQMVTKQQRENLSTRFELYPKSIVFCWFCTSLVFGKHARGIEDTNSQWSPYTIGVSCYGHTVQLIRLFTGIQLPARCPDESNPKVYHLVNVGSLK